MIIENKIWNNGYVDAEVKKEVVLQQNFRGELIREIVLNDLSDLNINIDKVTSWMCADGDYDTSDLEGIRVIVRWEQGEGYKINYTQDEEQYDAEEDYHPYQKEMEVLVYKTDFEIVEIGNQDDLAEMGYINVIVK